MRAVQVVRLEGPSGLDPADIPEPERTGDEVLIEVHAAGVTFPDVLMSHGMYQMKVDLPFVPGTEVAGVVREAPADSGFTAGDRVAAFIWINGYQELTTAPPMSVFPLPDGMSFRSGAAAPMNYLTAEFALLHRGRLQAGETVLVHGAAGGVGTATTQLAHAVGARVIAVVSTDEKAEVARQAGADEVVRPDDFLARVKELTDGRGVDVVVDPVGGDRFTDSLRCLAIEGRLLVIGFTAGEIPTVKVNRLLLTNTSVVGVAWGEYAKRVGGSFLRDQWNRLLPHFESGALDPLLGPSFPLERAGEALAVLDERRAMGNVTVDVR